MRPAEAADGAPHRDLTQFLPRLLRPPGAVLQHRRIGGRFQSGAQERVLLATDRAWAPRNRLALQRAGLALLHDRAFDGGHRHSKAARGFSHGLTVGHRSHQAFF